MRFEIFRTRLSIRDERLSRRDGWGWRLCDEDKVLAFGDSYATRDACRQAVSMVAGTGSATPIVERGSPRTRAGTQPTGADLTNHSMSSVKRIG